jgi:hypothetical protein
VREELARHGLSLHSFSTAVATDGQGSASSDRRSSEEQTSAGQSRTPFTVSERENAPAAAAPLLPLAGARTPGGLDARA